MIQALRKHYSFTELKRVDWDHLEAKYVAKADAARDGEAFARAIGTMLSELIDLHVWIEMPDGRRYPTYRSGFKLNADHAVVRSRLSGVSDFESIGFVGRTGTIGVAVISGLPADGDYQGLVKAIGDKGSLTGFIVDLRRNSGGSEMRAAQIAGLFASKRTPYARTQVRNSNGEMEETHPRYFVPTASERLSVPVVCLIGPGCVSSGEAFALMMKSLDQVTLIGLPTRGASGNPMPVTLSNGVRVWFSRWISLDLDGTPIENRGVSPEELIEHVDGGDATFDRALQILH